MTCGLFYLSFSLPLIGSHRNITCNDNRLHSSVVLILALIELGFNVYHCLSVLYVLERALSAQ